MRKLNFVFPLMVFFALAIFVSSCSDDFTEEDALLLQGDLLDQKLRTESELARALAQLQNQLAIALAEKQAELERLRLEKEAQLALALAAKQAEYDSLAQANATANAVRLAELMAEIDAMKREHEAELAAALAILQAELDAIKADQAAMIDSLKMAHQANLDSAARAHVAEIQAMLAQMQAAIDSALAAQAGNIEQSKIKLLDSLARVGGIVNYSVNVVPAGNASFGTGSGSYYDKVDASGIRVIVSQNGATYEAVTNAGGIANFPNMRIGHTSVTVLGSAVGHTDLKFVADLTPHNADSWYGGLDFSKITRMAATRVALFPLGDHPLAGTVKGQISGEVDLTNNTPEVLAGVRVIARLNVNAANFKATYFNTAANSNSNVDYSGRVISMAYQMPDNVGRGTTSANGEYTINGVPASLDGLPLEIETDDVVANQTLYGTSVNGNAAWGAQSVRTIWGTRVSAVSPIPNVPVARVVLPLPQGTGTTGTPAVPGVTAPGSGAAATAVMGQNGGVVAIQVSAGGSGYTQAPTVTINGVGVGATAVAQVSEGRVVGIAVTNAGSGYVMPGTTVTITPFTGNAVVTGSLTYSLATAGSQLNFTSVQYNGKGYDVANPPAVTVSGGNGGMQSATLTAVVTNVVNNTGFTITNAGMMPQGSTDAQLLVDLRPAAGQSGSGATATASMRSRVTAATVNVGTKYYTGTPTATFTGGSAFTAATLNVTMAATGRVRQTNEGTGSFGLTEQGIIAVRRFLADSIIASFGGQPIYYNAQTQGWINHGTGAGFDLDVYFRTMSTQDPKLANNLSAAQLSDTALYRYFEVSGFARPNFGTPNEVNQGSGYTTAPSLNITVNSGAFSLGAGFSFMVLQPTWSITVERLIASVAVGNPTANSYAKNTPPTGITFAGGNPSSTGTAPTLAVNGISWHNFLHALTLTSMGSGWTAAPVVSFIYTGSGTPSPLPSATASITGTVSGFNVVNGGMGYTENPLITVAPPVGTVNGTTIVAAGSPLGGMTFTNGTIRNTIIANPGTGFTAPPSMFIAQGTIGGTNSAATRSAVFTATIANGGISSVAIVDGGEWPWDVANWPISGSPASINLPITIGSGSGAATGAITLTNQFVIALNITNGGFNHSTATPPRINFANGGIGAAPLGNARHAAATAIVGNNGQVIAANVTDGGAGYTSAPDVTFSYNISNGSLAVPGVPSNAWVQASINLSFDMAGRLTGATIANAGTGYVQTATWDTLNVEPMGPGSGARVRVQYSKSGGTAGQLTFVQVVAAGSGYLARNDGACSSYPVVFRQGSGSNSRLMVVHSARTSVMDVYLGNGLNQVPVTGIACN